MHKRMALSALLALGISVSGMAPASAAAKLTAPGSMTDSCTRAGGTLEIHDDGTLDAADSAIVFSLGGAAGRITVVEQVPFSVDSSDVCSEDDLALQNLTTIIVETNGAVTFDLENHREGYDGRLANFGLLTFVVRADGNLLFDGQGISAPSSIRARIGEEDFAVGSLDGTYYSGADIDFNGGTGNDVIDASEVETTPMHNLWGNNGDDIIKGGALGDELVGGGGDDVIYGGGGDDLVTGQGGDDVLYGEDDDDFLSAADGLHDPDESDAAWGGPGDDVLEVDDRDTSAPGDGQDVIESEYTIGFDTVLAPVRLDFSDKSKAVTVDLGDPGVVTSEAGDTYYGSAEVVSVIGSRFADAFIGSKGDDTFSGGGGADSIKGGPGDDTLSGSAGADRINGGSGSDRIDGGVGDDVLYGSKDDDFLVGAKGADQAWGGKGTFDVCAAEITDSCEFKK